MVQEINTMTGELAVQLLSEQGWTPTEKKTDAGMTEFKQNGIVTYFDIKPVMEVAVFFRDFISEVKYFYEQDGRLQEQVEIGRWIARYLSAAESEND